MSNFESEDDDLEEYGPPLPPYMLNKNAKNKQLEKLDSDSSSDIEIIGPLPSDGSKVENSKFLEIENRALNMKAILEGQDSKPLKRESWMLELPEDRCNFLGLGPRKFLKRGPVERGDTSVWTDTPSHMEKKAKVGEEGKSSEAALDNNFLKKEEKISEIIDDFNKRNRNEALVDTHKKKIKKQQNEHFERKPFTREDDLQVNKFDDAQKAIILGKAKQLNNRFSSGKSKFL